MMPALAFATAFVVTLACGRPLIAVLRRLSYRQRAYEDAPQTHQRKTGTPTMGGVLFLLAATLALLFVHDPAARALALLVLGCGIVGALDDVLAIRSGRNRGMRARTKFLATALVGVIFLGMLDNAAAFAARDLVLGTGTHRLVWPHWAWYALSLAAILATTHAVNLADGLDGLAAGTVLPPLAFAIVVALGTAPQAALVELAIAGACAGFLFYNRHPAKLFMGDTGSLALGGALAGAAIVSGTQLLLPLVGGVFAAEALSVIVQVTSFKLTKKRVFRMSPLHHHFELGGWPETKVTARFWLASALLSATGFAVYAARA